MCSQFFQTIHSVWFYKDHRKFFTSGGPYFHLIFPPFWSLYFTIESNSGPYFFRKKRWWRSLFYSKNVGPCVILEIWLILIVRNNNLQTFLNIHYKLPNYIIWKRQSLVYILIVSFGHLFLSTNLFDFLKTGRNVVLLFFKFTSGWSLIFTNFC